MSKDSLDSLVDELRQARPCAPSARLQAALASALQPAPAPSLAGRPVSWKWVRLALGASWAVAAGAAALALAVVARHEAVPPPGPQVSASPETSTGDRELKVVPIGTTGYLTGASDEGLVLLDDGQPGWRVRLQYLDAIELRVPDGSGRMRITYPREEIRVVPLHTY